MAAQAGQALDEAGQGLAALVVALVPQEISLFWQ